MSISKSLLRAAKIQEKIDGLRRQLSDLLDRARAEIAATPVDEFATSTRRGGPKMLESTRGKQKLVNPRVAAKAPASRGKGIARSKPTRTPRGGRRSPLAGQKRASSPSGPLAPAVVKVLQTKRQAMNVRDILAGLLDGGYHFNSAEPKKNLAARIYRLKGVRQVSAGLFALA